MGKTSFYINKSLATGLKGIELAIDKQTKASAIDYQRLAGIVRTETRATVQRELGEGSAFLSSIVSSIGKGLGAIRSGLTSALSGVGRTLLPVLGGVTQAVQPVLNVAAQTFAGRALGVPGVGMQMPTGAPPAPTFSAPPRVAPSFSTLPLAGQTGLTAPFAGFARQPVSFPMQTSSPQAIPTAAAAPIVTSVAGRFARLFPNLWNWINAQRMSGVPMSISKLRALGNRVGVLNLVTLGLLTTDLAVDLLIAQSMGYGKPRRTNYGNTRALGRAIRRVEGFHRLCTRSDVLRRRTRRSPTTRIRQVKVVN